MNKYSALGLTEAAAAGRRILIVTDGQRAARACLDTLMMGETHVPSLIRRGNGLEGVEYPSGGCIAIRSWRSQGHRGISADTVYLDTGVERQLTEDIAASLIACTATSPTGEIVAA